MSKTCRHSKAFPSLVLNLAGVMWCPDCGAIRSITAIGSNGITFSTNHWLYPRGKEDVLKQMNKVKDI